MSAALLLPGLLHLTLGDDEMMFWGILFNHFWLTVTPEPLVYYCYLA